MGDPNETLQPCTQALLNTVPDDIQPKKPIISNALWDIVTWHKWGVLSVTVSILLLYLNIAGYAIGKEVGSDAQATANILGALQLAVKAHELAIVASLVTIAQQWIHGNLMDLDSGLPLALLGAEKELATPSFIISRGYLTSVRHACNLWCRRNQKITTDSKPKRQVGPLVVFLFVACGISALAGPASGVLMIPRVHWFYERNYTFDSVAPTTYPHIMINDPSGYGVNSQTAVALFNPNKTIMTELGMTHWANSLFSSVFFGSVPHPEVRHSFTDLAGPVSINTSTTWDRMLDYNCTGQTQATTVMSDDIFNLSVMLSGGNMTHLTSVSTVGKEHTQILTRWSARKYVVDTYAIVTDVSCCARLKLPCPSRPSGNSSSSPWCYTIGTASDPMDTPLEAQDLLLIADNLPQPGNDSILLERVYITEGPRIPKYPKFSASLVVVFDSGWVSKGTGPGDSYSQAVIPTKNVTVCSVTAKIHPAVAASLEFPLRFDFVDYETQPSHPLIFHEHWLDTIHTTWIDDDGILASPVTEEFVPPRNMTKRTVNDGLNLLGHTILPQGLSRENNDRTAARVEVAVAGAFVYTFSTLIPSRSQYPDGVGEILPDALKPESLEIYSQNPTTVVHVFRLGYGFRLSSRTGILGITILVAHMLIVLLGSLWQLFWERKVILAWGTIPEYVFLALGSSMPHDLGDTCARISSTQTLKSIIKVGETTEEHLEICTSGEKLDIKPVLGRFGDKDGSQVEGGL